MVVPDHSGWLSSDISTGSISEMMVRILSRTGPTRNLGKEPSKPRRIYLMKKRLQKYINGNFWKPRI